MAGLSSRSAACAASSSGAFRSAAAAPLRRLQQRPPPPPQQQQARRPLPPARAVELMQLADLDIDWSDTDTQIGALGAVLGLALGIGAPMFYASRDERDEARLEELRALNRATKEETGEYMSQVRLPGGGGAHAAASPPAGRKGTWRPAPLCTTETRSAHTFGARDSHCEDVCLPHHPTLACCVRHAAGGD